MRNKKYPIRNNWNWFNKYYRNAKYMHRQHPVKEQVDSTLVLELGRFLDKKCLRGQEWWEYINNHYLWHIIEKKFIRYQLSKEEGNQNEVPKQLEKVEAYGI